MGIPKQPPPPRSLKILYKMVLRNLELNQSSLGICTAILLTKEKGWISKDERDRLNSDLSSRKPAGKAKNEYWFKDKEERVNSLTNLIDGM